ncbi:YobI family P-loop NTPase [Thalassospira sp. CH_XMU1458]|uniref:YobI family P-loop NTPase n=1 Tax=Thalassospira sp. CH_XMU1458 TaxID=3107776 RepID=UPI00300D5F4C
MSENSKVSRASAAISSSNSVDNRSEYVDLAPTDKADPSGIYSRALLEATSNPNVFNIALTGPYGSGKSSIIKAFLKKYAKETDSSDQVLQISLAAFLPEALPNRVDVLDDAQDDASDEETYSYDSKVSKQEIERSILQQMLYGADANRLPLSRFKRIQSPGKWRARLVAFFIVLGVLACWYLIQNQALIFNSFFYLPFGQINWFNLGSVALAGAFVWKVIQQVYIKSLGVSLKSVSLKDIELKPEIAAEESILNRHLDEIIYFFQSTDYDLVVIEDLDRFNNPDIFVTLREINSLINANAGVKRQIRFLYALRDNMFKNTDRTKFFEFIVPVIPIINSSNSIDKIIEQEKRLSESKRPDRQFVREVSRYLDDLRLIQNIFNEYTIYQKNWEASLKGSEQKADDKDDVLDPNKLFAILIYKNVLPSDFELLHREKGKLAGVFGMHKSLIAEAESSYRSKIQSLENRIGDYEDKVPSDIDELRKIYAMALIDKLPEGHVVVNIKGKELPLNYLWRHENFEELLELSQISSRSPQGYWNATPISGIQREVNPRKPYKKRKQEIEDRLENNRDTISNKIMELRAELSKVRMKKFNELIRADRNSEDDEFEKFGDNKELVKFLVFEGFLDDSYYQYTSLFHSGRLSPSDNKFLIQIRAFNNPDPGFQIDNPKEVIAAMRADDFLRHFALNVIIVDCLFSHPDEYDGEIKRLLDFISDNFSECDEFFASYYESGKRIPELISGLLDAWAGFLSAVLRSANCATHVSTILAYLTEEDLKYLHEKDKRILGFLSINLSSVLAEGRDVDPHCITLIPFQVNDLESIKLYPAVAKALVNAGQYKLSIQNIDFIFKNVLKLSNSDDLIIRHYSTLLNSGSSPLINKVEDNFDVYVKDVLLELESNTEEDVSAMIKVLGHDEIETEYLEVFIGMQSEKVPSLHDVPVRLRKVLFEKKKIEATWANCLAFLDDESSFDREVLNAFLQEKEIETELSASPISGDASTQSLCDFLINNDELEVDVYRTYVRAMLAPVDQFPKVVDAEKWLILIEEEKIIFSETAFDQLDGYPEHQLQFIEHNIDEYMEIIDELSVDDDLREQLLTSDIKDAQKLRIVGQMDLTQIEKFPERASIVGQLYYRTNSDISSLDGYVVQALISHTKPTEGKIAFLNRWHESLSKDQVREVLQSMPEPYSDIRPGARPLIPKTDANLELVAWLAKRRIISSSSPMFSRIRVNNFKS